MAIAVVATADNTAMVAITDPIDLILWENMDVEIRLTP